MRVRTLLNPFSCRERFAKVPFAELFPAFNGKLAVEIGFGTGSFLTHYGTNHPEVSLVGYEIRPRLVQQAKDAIVAAKLSNVQALEGHGKIGLEDMFDDNQIDSVFVFHPDPWPKKKQQKRRVVNAEFIQLVERKLKPGGQLFITTDVGELWEYMADVVTASSSLVPVENPTFWEQDYKTRWQEMTQEQNRSRFFGAFVKP